MKDLLASANPHTQLEAETPGNGRGSLPLPRVLRWFWSGSLLAVVLTIVVAWAEYRMGWPQERWAVLNTLDWKDLLEYIPTFHLLHTEAFFHSTDNVAYPPFADVLFAFLYSFASPVKVYLIIAVIALAGALLGLRRRLVHYGIDAKVASPLLLTILLCSYPMWRLVPQGNIELFLWIGTAAGVWAYLRGHDDAAAVLWGLAGATKLYPVLFLILFLPRKRWRAFLAGVATFVGVTVLSAAYVGPSIAMALKGSLTNVFGYQGLRVGEQSWRELVGNHSLFTLVKGAATLAGFSATRLALPYYACGAIVFAVLFFWRVRKMPVANQLLAVSLFMVMLPTISYTHPLANLYAPWFVLVFLAIRADRAGARIPHLDMMILLFLPVFSPFALFTVPALHIYGGVAQACMLVGLFVCATVFPFEQPVASKALS